MADVTADEIADRETATKARLKFICGEIIERVREASESDGIGEILQLAREAARLAFELGFPRPPFQQLEYDRDPDPNALDPRTAQNYVGGFVAVPHMAEVIRFKNPDYIHAWGFRVYDPAELTGSSDLMLHALSDADVPGRPRLFPVNIAQDRIVDYRRRVERTMVRWIRILDMPPRPRTARIEVVPERGAADVPADAVGAIEPLMNAGQIGAIVRHVTASTIADKTLIESEVLGPPTEQSRGGRGKVNRWNYEVVRPNLKARFRSEFPSLSAAWALLSNSR